MPVLGNRLDLAIDEATQLLARADARQGQILVLADDAGESADLAVAAAERAADAGYSVNVLGVGTEDGAALQTSSGKTITNQDGQSYTTRLETDFLTDVSSAGNGHFAALSPDGSDLDTALADTSATGLMSSSRQEELHADTWNDMGYWLVFVPLLLAPLAFRKNLLLAILPAVLAMNLLTAAPTAQAEVQAENGSSISGVEPANLANALPVDPAASLAANAPDATTPDVTTPAVINSTANDTVPSSNNAAGQSSSGWAKKWRNLWLTPDQQAARDFQANNYQAAAQNFDNTDWKASAMYREGEFDTAANLYGSSATSFEDHYNQANSLAMSGQFETALSAYDEALAINPDDEDALFNRDLVEKLLEQQKQAEQEQQQDQQQAGGESSEDQQQQQAGGESSEDQQQQQAGGESSEDQQQQQAGGESSEDQQQQQAGGESSEDQQQQQAGGESSEDQQQQQAGGESSEDQQQQQAGGESSENQQQQQAGGESSEDQQQQQAGGESSGDQQQQQAGGESSEDQQQQAGGESSEDQQRQQAGGESSEDQQQQQAGGESSEDQQQQQAGGESSADQQQQAGVDPAENEKSADTRNAFQRAMDEILKGNGSADDSEIADQAQDPEQPPTAGQGYSEQDQAIEQQLRAVPDDPSGLLRARIRQHYARQ